MSRLPGMKYREVVERLRAHGFVFDRPAKGSHEIWYHPSHETANDRPASFR
jgi:predicted RNA binding protein YcfA (HicA-like mRNA interferase family)